MCQNELTGWSHTTPYLARSNLNQVGVNCLGTRYPETVNNVDLLKKLSSVLVWVLINALFFFQFQIHTGEVQDCSIRVESSIGGLCCYAIQFLLVSKFRHAMQSKHQTEIGKGQMFLYLIYIINLYCI